MMVINCRINLIQFLQTTPPESEDAAQDDKHNSRHRNAPDPSTLANLLVISVGAEEHDPALVAVLQMTCLTPAVVEETDEFKNLDQDQNHCVDDGEYLRKEPGRVRQDTKDPACPSKIARIAEVDVWIVAVRRLILLHGLV